jgi:hypothetical protein
LRCPFLQVLYCLSVVDFVGSLVFQTVDYHLLAAIVE